MLLLVPGGSAWGLTINAATCTSTSNALRFHCSIETDVQAQVLLQFCDATTGGSACTKDRVSESVPFGTYSEDCAVGSSCYEFQLTVWNLISGHDYEWQAFADNVYGSDTYAPAPPADEFTAGALPSPSLSAINLSITTSGSPSVQNLLFNYGCKPTTGPGSSTDNGYMIVADAVGNIVWYQDPRDATGLDDASIGGLRLTRPDHHVLAIDSKEYVLEYDMSGELLGMLSRSSGDFNDGAVDRYVHHDLKREGSTTYVLTAREYSYVDADDCDADGDTTEEFTYIMDGVMAFDHTASWSLVDTWSLTEIYNPYDCGGRLPIAAGGSCGTTLWGSAMSGCDWAHANSMWVDDAGTWLLSFKDQDLVIEVDESDGSLMWELPGDGSSTDWTLDTGSSISDPTFNNQHHAWWMPTANNMMLYDNHVTHLAGASTTEPRALQLQFNPGAGTYAVVDEWVTEPAGSGDCNSKGSAFNMLPSGHVMATCAPSGIIREFGTYGSELWRLTLSCDSTTTPSGNLYRAEPFKLGPEMVP